MSLDLATVQIEAAELRKLIYVEVTRQSQRSTTDKLGYLFDA
ncbi:hypothetical protein [Micromonospora sp. NPDC007230]